MNEKRINKSVPTDSSSDGEEPEDDFVEVHGQDTHSTRNDARSPNPCLPSNPEMEKSSTNRFDKQSI